MYERVSGRVTWRLLPLLGVCFFVSILDRVNVGFAALEMNSDLDLSAAAYGFGAGVFFLGYFLFEVPSNLLLQRFGARVWLARIMITWGVLTVAMGLVHDAMWFYVVRFLLGLAEAGFVPGVVHYLNQWYPRARIGKVLGLFFAFGPIANAVGSPLSTWLLEIVGWRGLFVAEGIPAVVLAFALLAWLPDSPGTARWLSAEERAVLLERLAADPERQHSGSSLSVLRDLRTWLLAVQYCLILTTGYALNFWLPQILHGFDLSTTGVGWLTAVPYVVAAVVMSLWGLHSDRTGERTWHGFLPCFVGAAGFAIGGFVDSPVLALLAFCVGAAGIYTGGSAFWSLPRPAVAGAAAATATAVANSFGNLGGFLGPYVVGWFKETTSSFSAAMLFVALTLLVGGLMSFLNTRLAKPAARTPITSGGTE